MESEEKKYGTEGDIRAIKKFFLSDEGASSRIAMKRCFGKNPEKMGKAEFMKITPEYIRVVRRTAGIRKLTYSNLLVVTLAAVQADREAEMKMEEYLRSEYRSKETSESQKRLIEKILGISDRDKAASQLFRIIRRANADGVTIDEASLLADLKYWGKNTCLKWSWNIIGYGGE